MGTTPAVRSLLPLILGAGLACAAVAADAPKPAATPTPQKDAAPGAPATPAAPGAPGAPGQTLRGPSTDNASPVPGSGGSFASTAAAKERAKAQSDAFNRAIGLLMAPTAREDVRLTPQQVETVNAARRDLQEAEEKFRHDNASELKELRAYRDEQAKKAQEREKKREAAKHAPKNAANNPAKDTTPAADPPPAMTDKSDMSPDERAALMERLRKLEEARPDPMPFQAKVWGVLTDPQREAVKGEMSRIAAELAEKKNAEKNAKNNKPAPRPSKDDLPNKNAKPAEPAKPAKPAKPAPKTDKPTG